MKAKQVAILGSTGSIGRQTLDVIASQEGLRACGLAAGSDWELLAEQAETFGPDAVALAADREGERLRRRLGERAEVLTGSSSMSDLIRRLRPDMVLNGIVGAAGLEPTMAAIECGAALAIANKETLVMAGAIVMPAARRAGVPILPVDSEHSAIFQCLSAGRREEVRRVLITASGGALRDWRADEVATATVEDALNHPTWEMGRKITIDSATLLNKALEVVEAHWLFDLQPEQIDVVIHPESIVHSCVEFRDGSVIAQMGCPDMTTPIAYALSHPHRAERNSDSLDLPALGQLTFRRLTGRFRRAVDLGFEAIRRGGAAGAVLNGANEAAVEAFLAGRIPFGQIVDLVEETLNRARPIEEVTLESLRAADAAARRHVTRRVEALEVGPTARGRER